MCEVFIFFLELFDFFRIINVLFFMGQLKVCIKKKLRMFEICWWRNFILILQLIYVYQNLLNEWVKGILSDVENLIEERIDEVIDKFFNEFKDGVIKIKDWSKVMVVYVVFKVSLNGYMRILVKKYFEI